MTIRAQTYSDPKNWSEHPLYPDLMSAVHICATANMVTGIKEAYPEFQHIISIRDFIDTLFSDWYNQETILREYLTLSRLIRDKNIKDSPLKESFTKNTELLLESIRFFVEAGIDPSNLTFTELTDKEKLFFDLWNDIEDVLKEFNDHRYNLSTSNEKDIIIYALNNLRDISEDRITNKNLHLVFHGFYFITPEQKIVIEYLRRSKIRITFFNFYDQKYPSTFNFIHAFYNQNFGLPDENEWTYINNSKEDLPHMIADSFLSAYEGNQPLQIDNNKNIVAYNSFFDFMQDVVIPLYPLNKNIKSKTKNSGRIVATNADILNKMLVPYYPEYNSTTKNLLNYPIGKFLVRLHQVYDDGKFIFSPEILMALFSSGWLYDYDSSNNGKDFTAQLQKIIPYFENCTTVNEWMTRMENLSSQNTVLNQAFGSYLNDRVLQSVSSPFSKFSYFNVPTEELQQIQRFFSILEKMVEALFLPNQSRNTLGNHFLRLVAIIQNHHLKINEVVNQIEKDLIESLLDQVDDSTQFLYDDIQKALQFYLSGKDNEEQMIIPFIEVDGEAFKKNHSPVFFTGLDEDGLPLGTFDLPWPLQPKTFEYLTLQFPTLEMHTLRNKSVKHISRYLLYISFKFLNPAQLNLSWIKNFLDKENLKPALYIKQLGFTEQPPTDAADERTINPLNKSFEFMPVDIIKKSIGLEALNSIDAYVEYNQCKKRFYYSYIVEPYGDYKDNFIHEFMFSEVVRFVEYYNPNNQTVNKEELKKLFPQWLDYKFNYKFNTSYGNANAKSNDQFKNLFFISNSRRVFTFPGLTTSARNKLYDNTKKKIALLSKELKNDNSWSLKANPGMHCKYCSHINYCDAAKFPIDKE
ncbi:hypothetical protein QWY14_10385 [Planococcus sp. N028]|uniref:PD-(D/E)XK endonuclease-like domain-containing protein n=1 Tax=Planococcus shixiaomingii TaxID=3058393 RepID=A0ABT8N3B9_9BACL|nr:hypothetical protein [Planococcus sp. N028]MDN7242209.1 hypothetical protein [Planococcus sp. N028]